MKATLKTFVFVFTMLFMVAPTQAQFFKNLQKKAEEKIKREAERRAERRVNRSIDKTFDKAEGGIDKNVKGKLNKNSKKSNIELLEKYSFDWNMTMKVETKEGNLNMNYLINEKATYFGMILDMPEKKQNEGIKDMITIMDFNTKKMISLMDMGGNKIRRVIDIPDDVDDENDEEYQFIKTDTKTILGYFCQGYKLDTKDGILNIYIAMNAPVNFTRTLHGKSNIKGINPNMLKKLKNGLMLEMTFTSHKKKKHNVKMICTSLKKEKRTINTSKYKSFGF